MKLLSRISRKNIKINDHCLSREMNFNFNNMNNIMSK